MYLLIIEAQFHMQRQIEVVEQNSEIGYGYGIMDIRISIRIIHILSNYITVDAITHIQSHSQISYQLAPSMSTP